MLTHEDFRRLKEGEWLNCKLLEAYFYLVCQDCLKRGICVKTLSSHFWSQFVTKGYEAAKHWIAKEHLFTYDVIFTLICAGGNHWTLMYMDFRNKCLWHLDPLTGKPMEKTVTDFKMLINSICKDKGLPFTWKAWDLNPEKVALQTNTSDCGVFVCQYALHLMDIGSKDIKLTRQQMISELKNKTLRQQTKAPTKKGQATLLRYFSASRAIDMKRNLLVVHSVDDISTSASTSGDKPKETTVLPDVIAAEGKTVSIMHPTDTGGNILSTKATATTKDNSPPTLLPGTDSDGENEGFTDPSDTPNPLATPREKYLWGLLKGKEYSRANVIIKDTQDRGRSAFAARPFKDGDFVCDYGGVVRKKMVEDWGDERNASLGLGCYCLDAVYNNETFVFDATASINDPGRYINHARRNSNLLLMPPVKIGEPPKSTLKIGFVAKRKIQYGEELFFDYGIRDPALPWLATDAKKVAVTLPQCRARAPQHHDLLSKDLLQNESDEVAPYLVALQLMLKNWRIIYGCCIQNIVQQSDLRCFRKQG